MKTTPFVLLVNAASQLIQQHAFDHLADDKMLRMQSCLRCLSQWPANENAQLVERELLDLCKEVNLYVDTATPQSLQQWHAALSCFGMDMDTLIEAEEQYGM